MHFYFMTNIKINIIITNITDARYFFLNQPYNFYTNMKPTIGTDIWHNYLSISPANATDWPSYIWRGVVKERRTTNDGQRMQKITSGFQSDSGNSKKITFSLTDPCSCLGSQVVDNCSIQFLGKSRKNGKWFLDT